MKLMTLLIASDIHGSARCCAALLERIAETKPDRVLLLGDLLYHGPRDALPGEYDTKAVAEMLNTLTPAPLCVRGNCDSEVDQMMLNFPILSDYAAICLPDGTPVYFTHGHLLDRLAPLLKNCGKHTVLLSGHTHVPDVWEEDGLTRMNPGSTSIPKGGSDCSYMTMTDGVFEWHTLFDGILWRRFCFED